MDKIDLDELERLYQEATPGPWKAGRNRSIVWYSPAPDVWRSVADCVRVTVKSSKRHKENAKLIAAMHEALPELIAENRALQERVRELEAELEVYKQPIDFPKLRESVANVDNSLSDFLDNSIKRAAHRP